MKKKAILISGIPASQPHHQLSFEENLKRMGRYLRSDLGGKWEGCEIEEAKNWEGKKLYSYLNSLYQIDYSFIYFGGHGLVIQEKEHLVINDNENERFPVSLLKTSCSKQTIIIEACRINNTTTRKEIFRYTPEDYPDIQHSREIFDKAIEDCSNGFVRIYSCQKGKQANSDTNGGFFTQAMFEAALNWNKRPDNKNVLGVNEIIKPINDHLKFFDQEAQFESNINGDVYFPFAISFVLKK